MTELSGLRFGELMTARKATGGDFDDDPSTVKDLDVSYSRWTKYGNDRLYFNGVRSDDPYVDLQTGEVSGSAIRDADVFVDGATLVVALNMSPHYYRFEIELLNAPLPDDDSDDGDGNGEDGQEGAADGGDKLVADGGEEMLEDDDEATVEQYDILLSPPGIDRGGHYNRPAAQIVLDVRDGAVMLVGDDGYRRGPFKPGYIQERVEMGRMLNAGQADTELRGYIKAIDEGRDDPKAPDLASTRIASLMELVEQGLSAAEALDYWAVEEQGYSQGQWAGRRGRTQQAISENVMKAKEKIGGLDE